MSFTFIKNSKEKTEIDRFSTRLKADQELWAQFEKGSNEAFVELYKKYRVQLLLYIRFLLGTVNEEKDVFQETWTRLFGLRGRLRIKNVEAMLIKIAKNLCLRILQKRKSTDMVSKDEAESALYTEEASNNLELEESAEAVRAALVHLSIEQREIVILREIEGCDYKTIAELFDIGESAARKRHVKALEEMRTFLKKWLGLSEHDHPQEHL